MKVNFNRLKRALRRAGITGTEVFVREGSIHLKGTARDHGQWLRAGNIAASFNCRGVVNDLRIEGSETEVERAPEVNDAVLNGRYFDVLVIGGGIIGSATARELKRWNITVALLEKESDLAFHASGRNDGMVHPGFAPHPGSKKAYYNVRGNSMYEEMAKDLGLPFRRCGSMFLFKNPFYICMVPYFFRRARKNGVKGCRFFSRRKVFRLEPHVTRKQWGAFYFPTTAVTSPYLTTIAYAENAVENGAEVFLNTKVYALDTEETADGRRRITMVRTNRGTCTAGVVINAAGVWADRVAEYAGDRFFSLHFRKGVDCILDKKTEVFQARATGMPELFQLKSKTKGGGIVPTVEGNLLIGPTAEEISKREEYSTKQEDIEALMKRIYLNRKLQKSDIITYFAGVRACTWKEDFIIEPSRRVENLIHAAGIQSPGLASAPAIAEDLVAFALAVLRRGMNVASNPHFNPRRHAPVNPRYMSPEARTRLIMEDPAYGRIICRCEGVSEGEVRDALRSTIPVRTMDGIKKRTRAGMGRCHGGFCTPRILEIMSAELGVPMERLSKRGGDSIFLTGETKNSSIRRRSGGAAL